MVTVQQPSVTVVNVALFSFLQSGKTPMDIALSSGNNSLASTFLGDLNYLNHNSMNLVYNYSVNCMLGILMCAACCSCVHHDS